MENKQHATGFITAKRLSLRSGDVIRSNNPRLRITEPDNPDMERFISWGLAQVKSSGGSAAENIKELNDFVHRQILKSERWYYEFSESTVELSRSVGEGRGMCKEMAATLIVLLEAKGIKAYLVSGTSKTQESTNPEVAHAWVEIDAAVEGKTYIADPMYEIFGEKQEVVRLYGYTPCNTAVFRPTGSRVRDWLLNAIDVLF